METRETAPSRKEQGNSDPTYEAWKLSRNTLYKLVNFLLRSYL